MGDVHKSYDELGAVARRQVFNVRLDYLKHGLKYASDIV